MSETPWDRIQERRSIRQEKRTARMPGARAQINSGRIWSSLRDNKLNSFVGMLLIDNKTTESPEKESYKLSRKEWLELRRDANRTPPGCRPALQIDLKEISLMTFELGLWDEVVQYVLALEAQILDLEQKLEEGKSGTA